MINTDTSSTTPSAASFLRIDLSTATAPDAVAAIEPALESPKFASSASALDLEVSDVAGPSLTSATTTTSGGPAVGAAHAVSRHTPLPSPSVSPRPSSGLRTARTLPRTPLANSSTATAASVSFTMALAEELEAAIAIASASGYALPLSPRSPAITAPLAAELPSLWDAQPKSPASVAVADMLMAAAEDEIYGHAVAAEPSSPVRRHFHSHLRAAHAPLHAAALADVDRLMQQLDLTSPTVQADYLRAAEAYLFGLDGCAKDHARAFRVLRALADDAGVAKASALVGFCHEFGLGTEQSFRACEPYYMGAAQAGSALAMARLSFLRRYGRPYVHMNRAESEQWQARVRQLAEPNEPVLECNDPSVFDPHPRRRADGAPDPLAWLWWAAAIMGDASAQYSLGTCFHDGVGVEKSPEEAVHWYAQSAAQGSPRGEGIMGYCYGEGFGIAKDAELAYQYYERAAHKGETVAMYNLGYCREEAIGVEKDLREAYYWYKRAAECGNALAANSLGYFYEEGLGMDDKNVDEAVRWYRFAAEQGNPWAEHNLAYMYSTGTGVDQDHKQALYWYRRAAEQGHAGAQNKLAHSYQHGTGTDVDTETAVYWYRLSAAQRYPSACIALAWCLDNGVGTARDLREALAMIDVAVAEGYSDHVVTDWSVSIAQRISLERVARIVRDSIDSMSAAVTA
ncbi:hypothetical protein H9P43_001450 [Blastocladiella emersonii ATCC 22665]|nr:hypothetical protein H9P43_001450 [Blastocladiella emersonii ATCC 22665]